MTPLQMLVFAGACLLIGLSKGGLGGPLPVSLVTPLLALFMPAKEAVPLVLPFLIFADWFALSLYWRKWDVRQVRLMLPAAVVGAVMGGLLLSAISPVVLKIIIGVMALIVVAYKLLADRFESIQYEHHNWHAYLAGWTSALSSTLANTGGPPFTVYLLLQDLKAVHFIGTTTLFFTLVNLMKIPIFWQQGLFDFGVLWSVLWTFPIVPIGVWLGRKLIAIIDQNTFERVMIFFLVISVIFLFGNL